MSSTTIGQPVLAPGENPHYFVHRGTAEKKVIVFHETAGSKVPSSQKLVNALRAKRCGTHWFVGYEGEVVQLSGENLVVTHCQHLNNRGIGIDFGFGSYGPIRTYRGGTWPMSEAQLQSGWQLVNAIAARHGIPLRTHAYTDRLRLVRLKSSVADYYTGLTSHFRWFTGHGDGWLHELAFELMLRGYAPHEVARDVTGIMSIIKPRGFVNLPTSGKNT